MPARARLLAKALDFHSASKGIDTMESEWRKPLTALLAMVALLFAHRLRECCQSSRGTCTSGSRELAIRVAIGASRWQVVRQNLAESLVLACPEV